MRVPPVAGRLQGIILLAALLLLRLGTLPAEAGVDRWTASGPDGGEVISLLTHPTDPTVVYAGTSGGGAFISRDGGDTWALAGEGMLATRVNALALGDAPGAPLFAGTDVGIFRLDEGAGAWQRARDGLVAGESVASIVVDPADPQTLFATAMRRDTTGSRSVYSSRDGGESWTDVSGGRSFQSSLAVAGTTPTSIYAASSEGIYRSRDGGNSWTPFTSGLPRFRQVVELLADPVAPTTIYASVNDSGIENGTSLYKSVDGGEQWEKRGEGLPEPFGRPSALAIDPGSPGTLYAGVFDGVYRSTDGAASWQAVSLAPANIPIVALAVQPATGAVFAGGTVFARPVSVGALRSLDRGESWSSHTSGMQASLVTSVSPDPVVSDRVVISTERQGILATTDGGASWQPAGSGIAEPYVGELTRDPHQPEVLYTAAGDSVFTLRQIYRSTDFASAWEPLGSPFEESVGPVAVDAQDASTLYVAGDFRVYRSTTGGSQWEDVSGEICGDGLSVFAHPLEAGKLLAGCVEDSGAPVSPPIYVSFVLLSTDGGFTWSRVIDGPSGGILGEWFFSSGETLVGGDRPRTIFAGLPGFFSGGESYRSDDGGLSWDEIEGLNNERVQALVTDPSPPVPGSRVREIFACTAENGVLRSIDNGLTWASFNTGLTGANVQALAFDPRRPERIWAGTLGAGAHVRDHQSRGFCTPTATSSCLLGRFQVEVEWEDFQGSTGVGTPLSLPDSAVASGPTTSVFWFFRPDNPEVAVKVLDGRAFNGNFWVFYSGLSTVRYSITVTDTATGQRKVYINESGRLNSAGDTRAFSGAVGSGSAASPPAAAAGPGLDPAGEADGSLVSHGEDSSLLLLGERFQVDVQWTRPGGTTGQATGVPLTSKSGALWFFRPQNLEVFVKILDGRPLNGHYWLFFGSLSDLEFELTVTDTQTGQQGTYLHPAKGFGSIVDISLF